MWKSNNAIVTSMDYSSVTWDQAKSRLDSRTKSVPARFTILTAKNTVDEHLVDLIERKGQTTQATLTQLKRRLIMTEKAPKNAKAAKASPTPPTRELPKYNVNNLSTDLGIEPASVRILLRKTGVAKNENGVYGWDTKAAYDAALKELKAARSTDKPAKASAKAEAPAPAKAPAKTKKAA